MMNKLFKEALADRAPITKNFIKKYLDLIALINQIFNKLKY